jgi:hypothetical protein
MRRRGGTAYCNFDAADQQAGNATTRVRMTATCALRPEQALARE